MVSRLKRHLVSGLGDYTDLCQLDTDRCLDWKAVKRKEGQEVSGRGLKKKQNFCWALRDGWLN